MYGQLRNHDDKEIQSPLSSSGNQMYKNERVFKMWIESMSLKYGKIESILDVFHDGVWTCTILDVVKSDIIDWKKVNRNP